MFENFVLFGRCLCCLLPLFVNRQLPCLHTNSQNVLLPPLMQHRSLWCPQKSTVWGCRVGAGESAQAWQSQAKKPCTAGPQQAACTHKKHQILSTAEATAFATQFWDCKKHPSKASQHQLATAEQYVPNTKHGDACPNGVPALPATDNANDHDSE